MSSIFSKAFVDYAAERAIKTAAQTAVASLAVGFSGLLAVDWVGLGSVVGLATLTSLLTSVNSWSAPAQAVTASVVAAPVAPVQPQTPAAPAPLSAPFAPATPDQSAAGQPAVQA